MAFQEIHKFPVTVEAILTSISSCETICIRYKMADERFGDLVLLVLEKEVGALKWRDLVIVTDRVVPEE